MRIFLLAVLVAAFFSSTISAADPPFWIGKTCKTTSQETDCGTDRGLKCPDETKGCQCEGVNVFYYGELNKCVIPQGEGCNPGSATEVLTPNSECPVASVVCKGGYVSNANKRCILQNPDADCGKNDDCDEDKFQSCGTSTPRRCGCDANSVVETDGACHLKAGGKCREDNPGFPIQACPASSKCETNFCICTRGLEGSASGQCRVGHGGDCSKGGEFKCDTDTFQECAGGTCKCTDESKTWYDQKARKCFLLADSECKVGAAEQPCVSGGSCTAGSFLAGEKCVCDPTHFKNDALQCKLDFGKDCSGLDDQCNDLGFLKCSSSTGNGKCECTDPANMIFKNGACQIKADKKCDASTGPKCVANAQCKKVGMENLCRCGAGLSANSNGECVVEYGANCTAAGQAECNPASFLECDATRKQCKCIGEGTTTWYDAVSGKCLLRSGSTCTDGENDQKCVSHAKCTGTALKASECVCENGLPTNEQGNCRQPYGGDCTERVKFPCDESLHQACSNKDNKCVCIGQGVTSWYDATSKKCSLLAGSTCNLGDGAQACVKNANCTGPLDEEKCNCVATYEKNSESQCKLAFGEPCRDGEFDECNSVGNQVCTDVVSRKGTCGCKDKENMIQRNGVCRIKAEKACDSTDETSKCVAHASCKNSICTCQNGYTLTSEGECVTEYGTKCVTDSDCNSGNFLTCGAGGTCSCKKPDGENSTVWYNKDSNKCELGINSVCEGPQGQACSSTGGVDCFALPGAVNKTCQCKQGQLGDQDQGLVPSADKTQCFASYRKHCDNDDPTKGKCDADKFLSCGDVKKCVCPPGSIFDTPSNMCRVQLDSECEGGASSPPCVPNSSCVPGAGKAVCSCNTNYKKNSESICKLVDGALCTSDDECNEAGFEKCDLKEGKCTCSDGENTSYSEKNHQCFLLLGKPCRGFENAPGPFCNPDFAKCTNGKCACVDNLVPDGDAKCSLRHSAECKDGETLNCSASQHLLCSKETSKCVCRDKYIYNSTSRTCFGDFQAPCEVPKDCNANAHFACTKNKCVCETSFEWNAEDKTCGASIFSLSFAVILFALVSFMIKDE